ncbi:hypothetical protein ERX35_007145 [Macrococcus equipercicus]|uniref:DUF342 domain-containing protein n=1 Tax=Macrococcus equipercicus TaxID=69967 RepID=A0ABQ6R896_9STAP|nr:hypothetical protein [Macrococcus equipercicus]KAA1039341.1 hypothetical protein ERX35_007145 [Macrococcus equipercicus]
MDSKLHVTEPVTAAGGVFERINVEARADLTSSVETNELTLGTAGDLFIEGRLNAPYISNKGILDVMDTIETEALSNHQDAVVKAGDQVNARTIDNDGTLDFGRSLRADTLHASGTVTAGFAAVTTFQSSGKLTIDQLSGDDVHIKAALNSTVNFINAAHVTVKAQREALLFKDDDARLVVKEIAGNDIVIENVVADLVRGDRVSIGQNCIIKVVEYTESYQLDDSSDVYELGKISRD